MDTLICFIKKVYPMWFLRFCVEGPIKFVKLILEKLWGLICVAFRILGMAILNRILRYQDRGKWKSIIAIPVVAIIALLMYKVVIMVAILQIVKIIMFIIIAWLGFLLVAAIGFWGEPKLYKLILYLRLSNEEKIELKRTKLKRELRSLLIFREDIGIEGIHTPEIQLFDKLQVVLSEFYEMNFHREFIIKQDANLHQALIKLATDKTDIEIANGVTTLGIPKLLRGEVNRLLKKYKGNVYVMNQKYEERVKKYEDDVLKRGKKNVDISTDKMDELTNILIDFEEMFSNEDA